MNTKILVTGASGFLGRALSRKLALDTHIDVTRTSLHQDRINSVFPVDLLNFNQTEKLIKSIKPDIIFHLAAYVNLSRDYTTAKKCFELNLLSTLNLLEAIKVNPPNKFIFASTEEIYGNNKLPYKEQQFPQPPSMYSISKVAGEQLCKMYCREYGFHVIISRIATFYGSGDQPHRLIPTIIKNALFNEPIPLNSGTKKRDYIYIDDAVEALNKIIRADLSPFEIINVGGGKSYSLTEVVTEIIFQTKSRSGIIFNAFPDRLGEADEWLMDISKAKHLLDWQPKISLKQGLQKTIANLTQKD